MSKPTFREFAKHENKLSTRLIEAKDNMFYIEDTPYKFKYVQYILFLIITAVALLISYLIPSMANKTNWGVDDYRNIIKTLLFIPLIYFIVTEILFSIELPQRYIFAGFKQVSEDYFEKSLNIYYEKKPKPSIMDILREPNSYFRSDQYIYCYNGQVFKSKYNRVNRQVWSLIPFCPLIIIIFFFPDFGDETRIIKDTLKPFYITAIVSLLIVIQQIMYPAIRYVFNKFEEVDINEINKKEEYHPRPIIE